jgi:hypothetical protein
MLNGKPAAGVRASLFCERYCRGTRGCGRGCPDFVWGMFGRRAGDWLTAGWAVGPHRPANRQRTDYDVVTYLPR